MNNGTHILIRPNLITSFKLNADNHGTGIRINKTSLNMIYFLNRKLLVLGEQLLLVKAATC